MRKAFADVAGEAIEETRRKFRNLWRDPEPHMDAVNFALGMFTGAVLRRMRGDPDPDPVESPSPQASTDATPLGRKSKSEKQS